MVVKPNLLSCLSTSSLNVTASIYFELKCISESICVMCSSLLSSSGSFRGSSLTTPSNLFQCSFSRIGLKFSIGLI